MQGCGERNLHSQRIFLIRNGREYWFQYLAAGKPIVCNVEIAYDDVITDNRLGIARDIDTPEAFAQAIREVAEQPRAHYDAMCDRVRRTAKWFDYKLLAEREIEVIEAACR